MPISDFLDLMPHIVTVQPFIGHNAEGAPAFGPPTAYPARVIHRSRLLRDDRGEEVMARGEIWLATTDAIAVEDRITLPDGTSPPLLNVERLADEKGEHHLKLFFANPRS